MGAVAVSLGRAYSATMRCCKNVCFGCSDRAETSKRESATSSGRGGRIAHLPECVWTTRVVGAASELIEAQANVRVAVVLTRHLVITFQ